ncbi:MAG: SDR family oxidoreductase [Candidatus Omnitrophica bacterium]|nr:SDR family oxidoreductase [Candidatus Omnitrophota bacterium]
MKKRSTPFTLDGKNMYVLGGGGLIGAAVVKALAASGARVIALDRDAARLRRLVTWACSHGKDVRAEVVDASDLSAMEKVMRGLVRRHGAMSAWVNASYPRSKDWGRSLEAMTPEYLRENIDVHLNSCLWTARVAALIMKEHKKGGVIVNFGSIYGMVANDLTIYEGTQMSGEMLYCGMKAGIINATRYLASYFGAEGIRANCICPGGIFDKQNPVFVKQYAKKTPLKRMGTPDDIAWPVVFLCSDAAAYMTGAVLSVDGGWTAV